jgi:hypothetical protein
MVKSHVLLFDGVQFTPVPGHGLSQVDAGMDEEAGVSHLLPKVMVPYVTRAGETPRKVQIQR